MSEFDLPSGLRKELEALVDELRAGNHRLITAESLTAGLISGCIAFIPGSSAVLEGGFVTYSNEQKTAVLGVPADLLAERTPYDADVARAMAEGAVDASPRADLSVAVTGVAGPGPADGKPAGLVFVAVSRVTSSRGDRTTVVQEHRFQGTRQEIRLATVEAAVGLLRRLLLEALKAHPSA